MKMISLPFFDENNPPVGFVFPITLESLEDGEQYTANNEEELDDLIEECGDFGGGWDDDDDDDDDDGDIDCGDIDLEGRFPLLL